METGKLLSDPLAYNRMSRGVNPYGDGHASERIEETLIAWFEERGGDRG